MTNWKRLSEELPSEEEYAVLLFPVRSDVGIMYTVSNPFYARATAIHEGYTHWCKFELAPKHHKMQTLFKGDDE